MSTPAMTTPPEPQGGEALAASILREMRDISFGVSGKSAQQVNEYLNHRAADALAALSGEKVGMREAVAALVDEWAWLPEPRHGAWVEVTETRKANSLIRADLILAALGLPPPVVEKIDSSVAISPSEIASRGLDQADREPSWWLPIETADKTTDQFVLVWSPPRDQWPEGRTALACWQGQWWGVDEDGLSFRGADHKHEPTHWRPLPRPPEGLAPTSVSHMKASEAQPSELCSDCPPVDYPTNITRCETCPRLSDLIKATNSTLHTGAGKP